MLSLSLGLRLGNATPAAIVIPPPEQMTYSAQTVVNSNTVTLPQTYSFTPVEGSTGTVITVLSSKAIALTITMGGVAASLTASAIAADRSTFTYYCPAVSGSITISSDSAFVSTGLIVSAISVSGGTIRSWHSYTQSPIPPLLVPDSAGMTLSFPSIPTGEYTFAVQSVAGMTGRTVSPSMALVISQTQSTINGQVNARMFDTAGTNTFSGTTGGYRVYIAATLTVFSQLPAPQITLAAPLAENFVYPLDITQTSAVVPISGTFANSTAAIEVRVIDDAGDEVQGWETLVASPTGRTFSGSITVDATTAACRIEARFAGETDTFSQNIHWRTGLVFLFEGQSNIGGFLDRDAPEALSPLGLGYRTGASGTIGFVTTALLGNGHTRAINDLIAHTGLPVCVINSAQSAQPIAAFLPGTDQHNRSLAAISLMGGKLHGWDVGHGEANAAQPSPTYAEYQADIVTIRASYAAATGVTPADIPLAISGLGQIDQPENRDSSWATMRDVLRDLADDLPACYWTGGMDDSCRNDPIHWFPESYELRASRLAWGMARAFGIETVNPDFRIASAVSISDTQIDVTVTHALGDDFEVIVIGHRGASYDVTVSATGDIYGFEATGDAFATSATCIGVKTGVDTFRLTHAAISGGAASLRHLYGKRGAPEGLIRDNGPLSMPLGFENDFPVT